jgi:hypothetical protein
MKKADTCIWSTESCFSTENLESPTGPGWKPDGRRAITVTKMKNENRSPQEL